MLGKTRKLSIESGVCFRVGTRRSIFSWGITFILVAWWLSSEQQTPAILCFTIPWVYVALFMFTLRFKIQAIIFFPKYSRYSWLVADEVVWQNVICSVNDCSIQLISLLSQDKLRSLMPMFIFHWILCALLEIIFHSLKPIFNYYWIFCALHHHQA
jgi:hypothetical protein